MLQKILDVVSASGFLKQIILEKNNYCKIGPVGLLLQNNLKTQWFNNVVINKDITVFPSRGNVQDTFNYAKKVCLEKTPFGIAETLTSEIIKDKKITQKDAKMTIFKNLFEQEDQLVLKSTFFVPSTMATQFFHQWQKQRRMWWRKFSASPGRYSLTDIKNISTTKQSVDIVAEYPWGSQLLESIVLNNSAEGFPSTKLQFKESKKVVQAWVVTSEVNWPSMFLNAICDAYDNPVFRNDRRELLRLHRKLAPYRISFTVTGSCLANITELNDLALYLTKQLRAMSVSTLLLPSSSKFTLEAQFKQYDLLGVPYTVILNDKTLVDGVSQLRNRDTTLKEQVHVTSLVSYVEKLFKND